MAINLEPARPADYLVRLAASDLGREYKSLVIDELDVRAGATVVDVGCGPGADLVALAEAVGPTGKVVGIDSDLDAVTVAAEVAALLPQVEVRDGDVHHLDLPDCSVDRLHTDRVLQHVSNPAAAVGETARVLRAGGFAGFVEPDWDTLVVDHPEPAIPDAYRRFITDLVVRNSRIGRQLPAMCEGCGLTVRRVLPVTVVFREVTEADQIFGFQRVTDRATEAGYLTAEERLRWLTHLQTARFFASMTMFLTIAERSG